MRKTELIVSGEVIHPKTKASIVSHEHTNVEAYLDQQNRTSSIITQSSAMSQAGMGDDTDLSFCVEDGFYESATLYGKTLVNCIQGGSSQDVVLPYDFAEDQYITIHETKESGALGMELKGHTLVNLAQKFGYAHAWRGSTIDDNNIVTVDASIDSGYRWCHNPLNIGLIKPNSQYTVIVEVFENTLDKSLEVCYEHLNGTPYGTCFKQLAGIEKGFVGTYKVLATSKTDVSINDQNLTTHIRLSNQTRGIIKYRVSILEGDYTNVDIPYFTGMASVKTPTVKTVGKNLFDVKKATSRNDLTIGENFLEHYRQNGGAHSRFDVPVSGFKVGKYYKYSAKVEFLEVAEGFELNNPLNGYLTGMNNYPTYNNSTGFSEGYITAKSQTITFGFHNSNKDGAIRTRWSNIQIEEVESLKSPKTTYESHTSSSLTIPNEVVLRSLPNGVKDTYNTRTGEYVRRIGEAVLDGTKGSYAIRNDSNSEPAYVGIWNIDIPHAYTTTGLVPGHALAENLLIDNPYHRTIEADNVCGVYLDAVRIQLKNVELSVDAYKAWLTKNPVKIQYQLATPIITKFQPQSTLKSWNATTHIYSEIPQNSLYPILSHSNPTYPVILKPSTKYSIVANSYDNNHTSSAINFNLGGATASATVGNRVTTVTTPSTLSNDLLTMSGRGNKLNNVMVIEGEVVGDEPYFEGICDVKSPVVKNVGKNLFNTKEFTDDRYIANTGAMLKDNNSVDRNASPYIKVRPKTAYIFSGMTRSGVTNGGRNVYYCEYDSNKNIVGVRNISVANPYILTTTQNTAYIRTTVKDEDLQTCVMEEASTPTAYEPHKSNTFMPIINDADVLTLTQDMFEQGNVAYNNAAMGSSYESMKESSTIRLRLKELIKVNPNSSYRVTVNDGYVVYFRPFDKNKRKLSNVDIDNPIFRDSDYTTDSRTHYISVFVRKVNDVATITLDEFNATGLGGSKEAGKIIVLRSLPNGVCDTFNTRTGEYVRRIGKIVFNGSEDIAWSPSSYSSANHYAFFTRSLSSAKNNISRPHCDKLPSIESLTEAQRDREGCMISSDGRGYGNFWIKLSSTKIENNVLSLKTYLKQNPITIQYELATPIVSIIDAQGLPYAYKDGHVQLSSGYNGQSLTPRLEYAIQTNRAGVIQANQDRLVNHEKRFRALEMMILHQLIQLEYRRAKGVFLSQTRQIFEGGIQMYHTKYDLLSEFIENKLYRSLEEVLEMLDVYFMLGDLTDGEYDVLYEMLMPSPKEIVEDELKFEGELNY